MSGAGGGRAPPQLSPHDVQRIADVRRDVWTAGMKGAVGGVVSKATRFSYALWLLLSTLLALAMLTDSVKSWILTSFQSAWSLPEVECEGRECTSSVPSLGGFWACFERVLASAVDCFSPDSIQQRAQNHIVNQTVTAAGKKLEASLERVVGARKSPRQSTRGRLRFLGRF